ncbi:MAG: CDP-alcohol phosphatidyltransferase family protein [Myxococcota bacterium]
MSAPAESSIDQIDVPRPLTPPEHRSEHASDGPETETVEPRNFAILDATHHDEAIAPDRMVAGLQMVRRQVRLAHVSDCDEAIVVTTPQFEQTVRAVLDQVWFDIEMSLRVVESSRLDDVLGAIDDAARARLSDGERTALYLRTTSAYHRHLPGHVRERAEAKGGICIYDEAINEGPIRPGQLFAVDLDGWKLAMDTASSSGFADLDEMMGVIERDAQQGVTRFGGDDKAWHRHLATEEDADEATEQIWQDCRKSVDGPVSRHFNRYISLFISRRVAKWGVKANHVTAVTALLGVLGGLLGLIGGYWGFLAAALAYKANSIIDGVDGEMARGKYEFSEWGAWLDNFSDDSKDIFFYIGVSVGAYTTGFPLFEGFIGPEGWLWVLGVTLFGKAMSLTGYYSFLIQNGIGDLRNFQFWFEEEDEAAREGLVNKLMAKLKVITKNDVMVFGAVLFAVVGLLPWFIFLSAIGQVAAGINIIAARFWQSKQQETPLPAE